mmetsp:Transcript_46701/g.123968  ORF Transcript_46701/g.123968 Transcript_46701/m.123968 type:complete len:202 (-) Transcript_46701:829-1434(-)
MPRYLDCSSVSLVSLAPRWPKCSAATFSSSFLGRMYTFLPNLLVSLLAQISSCASTWLVKEHDMTNEGWPVAQPRLSRRPSARMMTPWPSGKTKRSHWGLMFWRTTPGNLVRPAMSISLSKWPMLPTMALFFILDMWSAMMMDLLPVVVTKMSAVDTTSSRGATWKPSMQAWSAQIGSISVTMVRAPADFMAAAQPLPTSP